MDEEIPDVDQLPTLEEVTDDPRFQALDDFEDKKRVIGAFYDLTEKAYPGVTKDRPFVENIYRLKHEADRESSSVAGLYRGQVEVMADTFSRIRQGEDPTAVQAEFSKRMTEIQDGFASQMETRSKNLKLGARYNELDAFTVRDVLNLAPGGMGGVGDLNADEKEMARIRQESGLTGEELTKLGNEYQISTGKSEDLAGVDSEGNVFPNFNRLVTDPEQVREAIAKLEAPVRAKERALKSLDRQRQDVIDQTLSTMGGGLVSKRDGDWNLVTAEGAALQETLELPNVIQLDAKHRELEAIGKMTPTQQSTYLAKFDPAQADQVRESLKSLKGFQPETLADYQRFSPVPNELIGVDSLAAARESVMSSILKGQDAKTFIGRGLEDALVNGHRLYRFLAGNTIDAVTGDNDFGTSSDFAKNEAQINEARGAVEEVADRGLPERLAQSFVAEVPLLLATMGVGEGFAVGARAAGASEVLAGRAGTAAATAFSGSRSAEGSFSQVLRSGGSYEAAVASGLAAFLTTTAITAGFNKLGAGNVEDFTNRMAATETRSTLAGILIKSGVGEGIEEMTDALVNGLRDAAVANPDQPISDIVAQSMQDGLFGIAFGAGAEAYHSASRASAADPLNPSVDMEAFDPALPPGGDGEIPGAGDVAVADDSETITGDTEIIDDASTTTATAEVAVTGDPLVSNEPVEIAAVDPNLPPIQPPGSGPTATAVTDPANTAATSTSDKSTEQLRAEADERLRIAEVEVVSPLVSPTDVKPPVTVGGGVAGDGNSVAADPLESTDNSEVSAAVDLTEEKVAEVRLRTAMEEIQTDIAAGEIPDSVRSFAELADHLDANKYVNDGERSERLIGPLGEKMGWETEGFTQFTSELIGSLDAWLKDGRRGEPANPFTPQEKPKPIRKSRIGRAVPLHIEMFQSNAVVAAIMENGGLVSKTRGRQVLGERYAANTSLWDDSAAIKNPSYNFLYSKDGGRLPDQAAQDLYDAGLLRAPTTNALWKAIDSAVRNSTKQAADMRSEEKRMSRAEDFANATDEGKGRDPIAMSELVAGDKLDIDGELMNVVTVEYDEDGYVIQAILEDGSRFERQVIEGDQVIFVEAIDRAARSDDDFKDDDFDLETQTDEDIKAEEAARKQKEEIIKRREAPLTGSVGDLTSDMFGEGNTPLFNERRDVRKKPTDRPLSTPAGKARARIAAAEPQVRDAIFGNPQSAINTPVHFPLSATAQSGFGDPISAPEVIDSLKGVLRSLSAKVPIRVGYIRGRALGQYWPRQVMIRLLTANDISTAAHEVAHAIEDAIFGVGRVWSRLPGLPKPALAELRMLGRALYGNRRPNAGYDGEGFAEFFRMLIEGGNANVQQHAPEFTKWFDANLMARNADFAKAVNDSIAAARRWNDQGALNRGRESIAETPSRVRRIMEAGADFIETIPSKFVDMAFPLKSFVKSAQERAGRQIPREENPWDTLNARRLAHESVTAYMVGNAMIDFAGNRVGGSLVEAMAPVKGKQEDFLIYLWARRTAALQTTGRNSGLSAADAAEIINTLDSPEFQIAAQRVYDWNDGVLNYAAQASPDYSKMVDLIRSADPGNYIPLFREFKAFDERYRKLPTDAKSGQLVKRLKGSGRRIKNPVESMIAQARALVLKSNQKAVIDQIIRIADNVPGLGDMVFEVQPHQVPGATRTVETVLADLTRTLRKNGASKEMNDALDLARQQLDLEDVDVVQAMLTFWVPAQTPKPGEDPVIPIFHNGERRWFEVSRGVYEAINGMEVYRLPKALDLFLGVPSRTLRLGTTGLRASFSLVTNPLRDFRTLHLNSQANANTGELFFEWMSATGSGLLDVLTGGRVRSEWIDLFERLGGGMATPLGQDMLSTKRAANRVFEGRLVRTVDPRNWLDFVRDILQFPEKASRITEMKLLARDIGWQPSMPLTPEIAGQLITAAKQVTTDFTAAGNVSRVLNQAMPFFNAQIQGPRAHIRAIRRNPRKFAIRGLIGTAMALALWWRYKDEEWWKEMPESERYGYTYIPFERSNGQKELIRIPRSFEADGIFMAGAQALADAWYQKEPKRAAEWFGQFFGNFAPSPPPPVKDTLEQAANWNLHFESPIIPRNELDLPADEQFSPYTSTLAIKLGELSGLSPRRIDHSIRSYFGGAGSDLAAVFGRGTTDNRSAREGELADIPVIGTLFQRGGQASRSSESVDGLYERLDMAMKRERSRKHQETKEEKESRLMLQDAVKAVAFVSDVVRLKWSVEDRRKLEKNRIEIAREAVKAFDGNARERSKFREWRKNWESLSTKLKKSIEGSH